MASARLMAEVPGPVGRAAEAITREEASGGLDPLQREILEFERSWWRAGGSKQRAVRARFGLSSTRYHQVLMRTIDLPPALAYDPVLVRRLRRLREARRRARFVERLGLRSKPG